MVKRRTEHSVRRFFVQDAFHDEAVIQNYGAYRRTGSHRVGQARTEGGMAVGAFEEVAALLPPELSRGAWALPGSVKRRAQELRLRAGREPTVVIDGQEFPIPGCAAVTTRDLSLTMEIATCSSAHTALESIKRGYFTVKGGHRIGLCGKAAVEEGRVRNLNGLSSLNLRIAHDVVGCGEETYSALLQGGRFQGALLMGPPGSGKTTLLRDLVRLLSDGGLRVGLCDERGEVAALWEGLPQLDVGSRTDVMEGLPKAQGLLALLRGMNPQVLACDEITDPADMAALEICANCGVTLLATVHGVDQADLRGKPLYRGILERHLFSSLVKVSQLGCKVESLTW